MSNSARLEKLEATERRALLRTMSDLERQLLSRMTAREQFVAQTMLLMNDLPLRDADEDEHTEIVQRRRVAATIPELRDIIESLNWAIEELDGYEEEPPKVD